jgi:excisionase family DNA binding protein
MTQSRGEALRADDVLLTPSEAGQILGITPDAVRALNNRGGLVALKTLGGRRLFRRSDVERLAQMRNARQTPARRWEPMR